MSTLAPDAVLVPPAYLWIPPRRGSYGDEAVDMARAAGIPPDPEQCLSIDAMLSYGPGGAPVALETCRIEARQNGKTTKELIPVVLFDLFTGVPDKLIWTAHLFKTAHDAFNDFERIITNSDFLRKRVRRILAGQEKIVELMNGARLEFLARSKGGGRGLSGRRIVFDEALILTTEAMGALMPTASARPGAQFNYASSAARADSTQLQALVKRGRAGGDPSLIYIEHGAAGGWDDPGCLHGKECRHDVRTPGCALDREDLWLQANHSIARGRITVGHIRNERRALATAPLEFGRERLGWHEAPAGTDPDGISQAQWEAAVDPSSAIAAEAPVVFAMDASPNGTSAAIAVAGRRADGRIHMGVIAYGRGVDWLVDRIFQLQEENDCLIGVVWQPAGPVGAIVERLKLKGVWNTPLTAGEAGQACGLFKSEMDNDQLRQAGGTVLDDAFTAALRRVGAEGVWSWGRRVSTGDISPLWAATEAVWGLISAGDGDPQILEF